METKTWMKQRPQTSTGTRAVRWGGGHTPAGQRRGCGWLCCGGVGRVCG